MEALGAAASIAGLVSLAIEIPKLIDTAVSIHAAPEEAAQLSRTVDALVVTLQKLEAFLKTDEAQDLQMTNDSALTVSISACQKRVVDLSRKLRKQTVPASTSSSTNPISKVQNVVRRFRWPLEKTECLNLITELHTMESTFEFCLVMKNCQQMSRSHKEVISHFKTQSRVLNEMSASFPEQAEHTRSMLSKLGSIQLCVEKNVQQFDSIRIGVETLQEMNRDSAGYQADRLHGQALEWLSPLDTSLRHEEIGADRFPKTCGWIINDADFISWCQTSPSEDYSGISCWIGDPGQGKTYTMSRIVEHLQTAYPNESGAFVTYLYCDYQRTSKYSVTSLVGALLRQLLGQFETLPENIVELVRHSRLKLRRSNAKMEEMVKILTLMASQIRRLFICIDALDETPCAEALIAACQKLPLAKSFFFIGRQSILQSLKRSYSSVSSRSIEPQNADINAVVAAKLATEAMRDPDLMPGDLKAKIQSSITRIADGMFLLATLHLTLVLSRNTIFQRRLALDDLPTTLPRAFNETLTRIQEHSDASQAFRILALIHRFGPMSLDLLQYVLAVEPSHTQFQHDNLPSRLTMLDGCMGLVRLDTFRGTSTPRDRVLIAHETLSTYFNSNQHILENASVEIAGSLIAILLFPESQELRHLQLFVERSWVSLLYDLKALPAELCDKVWDYVVKLNRGVKNGNYTGFPGHARGLLPKYKPKKITEMRYDGKRQSLLHTACMLELDGLSPIMERFSRMSDRERDLCICSLDDFGLSPMGWILFPSQTQSVPSHRSPGSLNHLNKKSLTQKLLRAESLMSAFPRAEPIKSLWTAAAMMECQTISRSMNHETLHFFTAIPLLWFFSNHSCEPQAMGRCIEAVNQYWNLDIWSAVGNAYRVTSQPNTLGLQPTSANKWNMIYVRCRELDHIRQRQTYDLEMDVQETDTSDLDSDLVDRRHPPSPPEPPYSSVYDGHTNILIVFEPGRDIQTPSLALALTSKLSMACFQTREDTIINHINPFPNIDGYVMYPSLEAILRFGKSNDHIGIINFALSKLELDPKSRDANVYTAMQLSRQHEKRPAGILLPHLKIDSEIHAPGRSYLLHYHTYYCQGPLVSDLLKSHIDIDLQDDWGRTALHYAVKIGAENMICMLLERGASVDVADATGRTALHYAVDKGSRNMIDLLMKQEPDVNKIDSNGMTPLHLAIIRHDLPTCQILFEPIYAGSFTPRNLEMALHLALSSGGDFAARLLCFVQSASLRSTGEGGPHPFTALANSNRIFKMITNKGESSKLTVDDLRFMTRLATNSNNLLPMTSLAGPKTSDWSATIRSAIENRADSVAAYLLRIFPVDVNHLQSDGETALHLAVIYDACQVFQLLLDSENIDNAAENNQGCTALHLTLVHKRLHFLRIMLDSPRVDVGQEVRGSGATALHLAIRHDFIDAVPLLLSCPQINFDKLDGSGRAVLHHAVLKQNVALVKLLLGCPTLTPTIPSRDGRTALAYAALCAGEEMIALLLEAGQFDLDLKDTYGKTAVDWARQNSIPRVFEMLEAARLSTLV